MKHLTNSILTLSVSATIQTSGLYHTMTVQLGHRWMVTYSAPVLHYHDNQLRYLGTTGIDIDLSNIPFNQCSEDAVSTEAGAGNGFEKIFTDTHLCEPMSTVCKPKDIRRFESGLYTCQCRDGFYKPNTKLQYFQGSPLEELDPIDGSIAPSVERDGIRAVCARTVGVDSGHT